MSDTVNALSRFEKSVLYVVIVILSLIVGCKNKKPAIAPEVVKYLDTILDITQKTSLFTNNVDWKIIRSNVYKKAGNAQKKEEVFTAVQYMFDQLEDEHGGLLYKGKLVGRRPKDISGLRKVLVSQIKGKTVKIKTGVFQNKYGYIRIPSMLTLTTDGTNTYAQELQDSICKLNVNNMSGWIIDLRLNVGGNMYPMIAGIGNLIGDGPAGHFTNWDGKVTVSWFIENGEVYLDQRKMTDIKRKCPCKKLPKIAVLISQVTGSAGESTAIALKKRANTRFFGEDTYGFVTANTVHQIDANSMLLVAECFTADRDNYMYKTVVSPDTVIVEGDNFQDLNKDVKIIAALKWLSEN